MEDLLNKDKSIQYIVDIITRTFGNHCFILTDFWDADKYAVGLRKNGKLIYISTWDFKDFPQSDIKFYAEFELIDLITLDLLKIEKRLSNLSQDELIKEIKNFFN